jgi:hypothetical protein
MRRRAGLRMLFMTGVHGNTSRFDRVALGAILTNTVVLGWSWLDHTTR